MEQVPDFWRTEVWHPLSVHFPIALLLFGTFIYLFSLFQKGKKKVVWIDFSRILLIFGALAAWVGIYTGGLADGVVSRKICDPTVLKDHETSAYVLSVLFSIATLLLFVQNLKFLNRIPKLIFQVSISVLLLSGSGFLIYTGHLGATVVYQQGGGVYHPSSDCREFE